MWNLNQHTGVNACFVSRPCFRFAGGSNSATTPLGVSFICVIFGTVPSTSAACSFSTVSMSSKTEVEAFRELTAFRVQSPTPAACGFQLISGAFPGAACLNFSRVSLSITGGGPGDTNTAPEETGHVNAPVRSISNAFTMPPT